jgi:Ankyrin repeat
MIRKSFIAKNKPLFIMLSTLIIGFLLWLITYALIPYGNHFLFVWGFGNQDKNGFNQYVYSKTASNLYLQIVGISCSLPLLDHSGLRIGKYLPLKDNAISQLIILFYNKKNNSTLIQKEFILQHLYKTIEKCDVNIEHDGYTPLFDAILAKDPLIVTALINRRANVNQVRTDALEPRTYTPLYLAEILFNSEKDEATKQSLISIIEILKKAGGKSEVTKLSGKKI